MHIVPSMSKQYVIDDDSVKVGSNLKYEILSSLAVKRYLRSLYCN